MCFRETHLVSSRVPGIGGNYIYIKLLVFFFAMTPPPESPREITDVDFSRATVKLLFFFILFYFTNEILL